MIAALLLGALVVAQAAPVPPQQEPLTVNRAPVQVVPPPGMRSAPSRAVDRQFAMAAMQSSNAELAMAQLAVRRGRTDEVKSFAKKMISEHLGLMQALGPEAKRVLGATAVPALAPPDALTMYRLEHVADVDFDQTYVLAQVGGHLATLGAFQTEDEDGADQRLKTVAKQWTPTIQSHLQLAIDITQHIGGDSPLKTGAQ